MEWTERNQERLETAVNEADVVGVRSLDRETVAFLLEVCALPEVGPMDPDPRRMLVLHGVTELRFLLRRVTVDGSGPAVPLADLEALEDFFESLASGGSMYGRRFFDAPELTEDWPPTPSLVVHLAGDTPAHTFYWFNECGRVEDGETRSYCIEGTAGFADLSVRLANGTDQAVEDFVDDGVRWWQALQDHDPRVNVDAQGTWSRSRVKWRSRAR